MTVIGTIVGIFAGEHRFLSNFWPAPVRVHGILCPTVEHAYQASKISAGPADHVFREIVRARTPGEAKRLARTIPFILRPDWDRVRVDVMTGLVEQKFADGTALAARLLRRAARGQPLGRPFLGRRSAHRRRSELAGPDPDEPPRLPQRPLLNLEDPLVVDGSSQPGESTMTTDTDAFIGSLLAELPDGVIACVGVDADGIVNLSLHDHAIGTREAPPVGA
jgi:hypothetical protein